MTININETVRMLLLVATSLGALLGFFKLLMEVVLKPLSAYKEKIKCEEEKKSHAPLIEEIQKANQATEEVMEQVQELKQWQDTNNKITIYTAKTLMSLVTDISIKGTPNGATQKDMDDLREEIYKVGGMK